jgi:mRNA interferase RelE/StbE
VKTGFKSSFAKDLKSIKSKMVLESVAKLIENVEAAQDLRRISEVKKLKAKGNYYRIRLGNYLWDFPREKRDHIHSMPGSKRNYRYFP